MNPLAAIGLVPAGRALAGAMFTVGMSVLVGAGSTGEGPSSAPVGRLATFERMTMKYTPIIAMLTTAPRMKKNVRLFMLAPVLPYSIAGCRSAWSVSTCVILTFRAGAAPLQEISDTMFRV